VEEVSINPFYDLFHKTEEKETQNSLFQPERFFYCIYILKVPVTNYNDIKI